MICTIHICYVIKSISTTARNRKMLRYFSYKNDNVNNFLPKKKIVIQPNQIVNLDVDSIDTLPFVVTVVAWHFDWYFLFLLFF